MSDSHKRKFVGACHVGGAFLVPSHAGKFMRAKPQIIKRINHKAPLMRQVPPDVHYCGTWWPHKPPTVVAAEDSVLIPISRSRSTRLV